MEQIYKVREFDNIKEYLISSSEIDNFIRNCKSYIEKLFENIIKEEQLDKKYDIINEYYIYPYSIDFAFENIKVAIELDGEFHLQRIDNDIKKDKLLLSMGWRILRIGSRDIKEDYKNIKNIVINFLNDSKQLYNKQYDEMLSYKKYKEEKKKKYIQQIKQQKQQKLNKQKTLLMKLLNDYKNEYGIIRNIADGMNLSPAHVRRLSNKFDIELYKRK